MGTAFTALFCCMIGLLGSGTATGDPFDYIPGFIRFPFARSGSDFTNSCRGYGDCNAGGVLKLFHSGVDFQAVSTSEYVRTPFDPAYVIRADSDSLQLDWRVIFGLSANAKTGWGYHHLNGANVVFDPEGEPFYGTISPVILNTPEVGTHVHMDWCIHLDSIYEAFVPGVGDISVYDSYINPLDYFLDKPSNFDHPELVEVYTYFPGYDPTPTSLRIQNSQVPSTHLPDTSVYGQVHFVARPVSAPNYGASSDSVGVRYLRHRVLRQDPYTGEYAPLLWYDWRTLFSMNGFIPFLGDEFFDFVYATTSGHYQSEYLLNNCGTTPVGLNADSAFTNVWTAGYSRSQDWADGVFCRGAFDTRLGFDSLHQQSYDNATAMIPDGRYCVEMEAFSHGSSQAQTWRLPVLDVEAENLSPGDSANVKGFIVDNFTPHVESVLVYLEALPGEPDMVYFADWDLTTGSERSLADSSLKYLSEDEEQWIGLALSFSEPMDSLPSVWITGEWGGEVRWSSASLGSDYQFIPCEWDELNLGGMPYDPNGSGHWQCYRTELGITGYHGNLRLNIDGGTDLSGNLLDGDPSTVAARDPQNGVFSGHEEGVDNAYTWETAIPVWSRKNGFPGVVHSTNTPYGSLEVQLSPFYNQYKKIVGAVPFMPSSSCPYWHGFWMMRDVNAGKPPVLAPPRVRIIDFSGTTVQSFELGNRHTLYPEDATVDPHSYIESYATYQTGSTADGTFGDYLWVSVTDCRPTSPWGGCFSTYLNCFTANGLSSRHYIGSGTYTWEKADENIFCDTPQSARIGGGSRSYDWIEPNPSEPYNIHGSFQGNYFNFSPPGLNTTDIEPDETCLHDSNIAEASGEVDVVFGLSVDQNPVSSELLLRVSLECSGPTEVFLYDMTGRVVLKAHEGDMSAGVHNLLVPVHLPGGIYFCRLRSGEDIATGKVVIIR